MLRIEISTLSLHDALPILFGIPGEVFWPTISFGAMVVLVFAGIAVLRLLPSRKSRVVDPTERQALEDLQKRLNELDRKSTRLNSSHLGISYAVFCLKKKKQ